MICQELEWDIVVLQPEGSDGDPHLQHNTSRVKSTISADPFLGYKDVPRLPSPSSSREVYSFAWHGASWAALEDLRPVETEAENSELKHHPGT